MLSPTQTTPKGGSSQDLQAVTDIGSITTNNITAPQFRGALHDLFGIKIIDGSRVLYDQYGQPAIDWYDSTSNGVLVHVYLSTPYVRATEGLSVYSTTTHHLYGGYNSNQGWTAKTTPTGITTFDAIGTTPSFIFSDNVSVQSNLLIDSIASFNPLITEKVVNGTFATNITGWTGTGWVWASGKASYTGSVNTNISQNVTIVSGKTYSYSYDYNIGGGSATGVVTCGGVTLGTHLQGKSGTKTGTFVAINTGSFTFTLTYTSASSSTHTLDNVSVKEINTFNNAGGTTMLNGFSNLTGNLDLSGQQSITTTKGNVPLSIYIKNTDSEREDTAIRILQDEFTNYYQRSKIQWEMVSGTKLGSISIDSSDTSTGGLLFEQGGNSMYFKSGNLSIGNIYRGASSGNAKLTVDGNVSLTNNSKYLLGGSNNVAMSWDGVETMKFNYERPSLEEIGKVSFTRFYDYSFDNNITQDGVITSTGKGVNIISNPSFANGLTGWATVGTTWSISLGRAQYSGTNTTMSISQNSIPIVVGETYRYEFYYFASPVTGTLAGSITCGGVTLVNVTNQQFGRAEGTFVATNTNGFVYTVTGSVGTLKNLLIDNVFILGTGASTFGGGIVAGVLNINNTTISKDGRLSYVGSARKQWTKYTANTVTLTAGTSADTVADLRTMTDGLFYTVVETATTPGIDLIVDFINVTAFEKCRVLAGYEGAGTHALALQLYNWTTSAWDTFNAMQTGTYDITTANGYILENYEFTVYDDTNYIGTAGNLGKTRVRFYHTMTGNPAHDLHIDEVSLRQ